MLKILVVVLLILVIASLFTGMTFLFKDADVPASKRALYALGIRITFAAALLLVIFFGLSAGELELNAPWHKDAARLQHVDEDEQAHPDNVHEVPVP